MRAWDFKVKNKPQEIVEKLDTAFGSIDGFVFKMDHDQSDSVKFNFRKRILYPDQILHRNRIIVNGSVLKTEAEDKANVKISFSQHFFTTVTTYMFLGAGIFAIILAIGRDVSAYIPGALLLAAGIIFWIALRQKFEKDIQKYKTLISEILEL